MAIKAFRRHPFHVTIDTLFLESVFILKMLAKTERIGAILMQHVIVVTIPAGVTREICR